MPVPKKKTSKSKKSQRRFVWKQVAEKQALKAISIGKSVLKKLQEEL